MKHLPDFALCVAAVLFLSIPQTLLSQTLPRKPVRMVLAMSGGVEILARTVADKLALALDKPVIVDVQSAASGAIGAEMVARSAPDGNTILYASPNSQVMRVFLVKKMTYDPVKDFTAIMKVTETVLSIVANTSIPVRSFRELIEYARNNPGKISYATSGIATTHHLNAEQIGLFSGVNMVHVPYKSGPQQMVDLIGGRVAIAYMPLSTAAPYVATGKVKVLAVLNNKRYQAIADVPTVKELVPGFEGVGGWTAFFGPAGMPKPLVDRFHAEILKAISPQDLRAKFESMGLVISPEGPEELNALVRNSIAAVGKVVKRVGIEPE